jgi:hypothetical protein
VLAVSFGNTNSFRYEMYIWYYMPLSYKLQDWVNCFLKRS